MVTSAIGRCSPRDAVLDARRQALHFDRAYLRSRTPVTVSSCNSSSERHCIPALGFLASGAVGPLGCAASCAPAFSAGTGESAGRADVAAAASNAMNGDGQRVLAMYV